MNGQIWFNMIQLNIRRNNKIKNFKFNRIKNITKIYLIGNLIKIWLIYIIFWVFSQVAERD